MHKIQNPLWDKPVLLQGTTGFPFYRDSMNTTNKLNSKGDLYAPEVGLNGEYTKLHSDSCIRESCRCISSSGTDGLAKSSNLTNLLSVDIASVKEEESRSGSITLTPTCSPSTHRRTTVTDTYSVTYLEYKGKLMARPMKAAFAFFKGIPHSTEVARNKMIAQNLGLTVHSGAAKKVLSAKYVPHQGSREQQRRAKQLERAAKKHYPPTVMLTQEISKEELRSLYPPRPDALILDDIVEGTNGNDTPNLQQVSDGKVTGSKDN